MQEKITQIKQLMIGFSKNCQHPVLQALLVPGLSETAAIPTRNFLRVNLVPVLNLDPGSFRGDTVKGMVKFLKMFEGPRKSFGSLRVLWLSPPPSIPLDPYEVKRLR